MLGDLSWFQAVWVVCSQSQPGPSISPARDVAAGQTCRAELICQGRAGAWQSGEAEQGNAGCFLSWESSLTKHP